MNATRHDVNFATVYHVTQSRHTIRNHVTQSRNKTGQCASDKSVRKSGHSGDVCDVFPPARSRWKPMFPPSSERTTVVIEPRRSAFHSSFETSEDFCEVAQHVAKGNELSQHCSGSQRGKRFICVNRK